MGEDHEPNLEDESRPSKVARVSSPDESSDAGKVTTAVASPLGLGLGLGIGGGGDSESSKGGGFTFMQMQEFHHQALIFSTWSPESQFQFTSFSQFGRASPPRMGPPLPLFCGTREFVLRFQEQHGARTREVQEN
ncbi:uncharacterized protein A4U43_C10F5880 [Asparagus officinalis]|uniref:Uncharacterized protein n=1 Tax=Asparagus officinalis TaxID=4686 RepID=A0A5P1E112_ASPOF|nr:uncharacterized protein A4U43_C10F5880 [Asparagus officinalis]